MCNEGRGERLGGKEQWRYRDLLSKKLMLCFTYTVQIGGEIGDTEWREGRMQRERRMMGRWPCWIV